MLEKLEVTLVGAAPLLMKNGLLADPGWEGTKELKALTGKRKKTDDDLLAIREAEWRRSLYLDMDGRVAIPSDNILALVVEGARKSKLGKQAQSGVYEAQAFYPLQYEGPKDIGKLYQQSRFVDVRSVVVQRARVMRTRPKFDQWSLPIQLLVETSVIETRDVLAALSAAGHVVGLGDFRPRFGRFEVQ